MRWLLWVCMVCFMPAAHAELRDPSAHFFQTHFGDFSEELANARQAGKTGVLIMFEQDECPFCARMKTTVLNQSEVQDYYRRHFTILSVNIRSDLSITDFQGRQTTEKAFALAQRARATPVFIFYGLDGEPLYRYTLPTKTAGEFMQLGRFVVEGAYRSMNFNVYKQKAAEPR